MLMLIAIRITRIVEPPLAIARASLRVGAVHLFVRLSVTKTRTQKKRDFSKTQQFIAMVSIDNQ